jgi:hypothetical protein
MSAIPALDSVDLRQIAALVRCGRIRVGNGEDSRMGLVDMTADWRHITRNWVGLGSRSQRPAGDKLACGAKKWNGCAGWSLRLGLERSLFLAIERGLA